MYQRKFAEMECQLYLKEESNSCSAYSNSEIRSIERSLRCFLVCFRKLHDWQEWVGTRGLDPNLAGYRTADYVGQLLLTYEILFSTIILLL